MKNRQGKQEDLRLYNGEGNLVYEFYYSNYYFEGHWLERTYDHNGNELTFKDSYGYWSERTYYDNGGLLTYKNSNGVSRTYKIPEYTMEELTKIVGKEFKIKK